MLDDNLRASRKTAETRPDLQISFEFFPPKTDVMEERFWESVHKLAPLKPRFVSVTYGAGGSTRERTLRMVSRIASDTGVPAAAHLTCVGATKAEVDEVVRGYKDAGVTSIVALRGDPPEGIGQPFTPHPEGYQNAADLVAGIRKIGDFDISVAAYPEKHPQSESWDVEIDNLKRKIDAGANRAITQMFFSNADYLRYVERAQKAGITAPIVPGIQPIHSFKQISGFAGRCGASIPEWLAERFDGLDEDPETHALMAAAVAAEQVTELLDEGITEFHFFTLNRSNLVLALARLLGRRP
ncbi:MULTISPECIES: methylenetetrahydrofolate reductase [NAD(P)H] [unclassified Devosia]|uniref:methylenetetrahydrofolate reductase [NAD(P)H] n=1 Tax=unclassified Devosia TaxID=196773 RepID=UPI00145F1131|nr:MULTISPECIES: methylenetetrahydrofolate reductase [NAD(P)H] [unclassified Devosia]MBJ6986632.1 methylenetetrahydrofolate reductase [NAD(P)H] [Devosia sp. MC521]MBK1793770.1 methylenetetrahydrofolate reductase [NAD(P)H] [Devosia sp. WQ 349K1]QMW61669.1 methylenetetrahydrofolate reductase [NAD(P)H] [Devosia sp. MC521]